MVVDPHAIMVIVLDHLVDFMTKVFSGDVFAVSILLITTYTAVYIVNKLTGILIFVMKRVFLLVIVSLASYQFIQKFLSRVAADGFTNETVLFGAGGIIIAVIAMSIAIYAALRSVRTLKVNITEGREKTDDAGVEGVAAASVSPEKYSMPGIREIMSIKTMKNDKSLGAVLAYLVIAEFGVFSSKTIAAPSAGVGLGFFVVFMVAAVLYVYYRYRDHDRGFTHLTVAFIVGLALSLLLGHFWGSYAVGSLFSLEYFATDSMVALVTGISLSLFMGGKEE
ncbi:MAG: hypothetical protein ABIH11_02855 [Candidatus Altiarchaeota archaeon]